MTTTVEGRHARTLGEVLGGMRATKAGALVGLILVAVGSIGPWATVLAVSLDGTHGDGKATLIMAAMCLLAVWVGGRAAVALATILVVVCIGVVGYDLVHVERVAHNTTILGAHLVSAGWGLYVALGGGILALFALVGEWIDL